MSKSNFLATAVTASALLLGVANASAQTPSTPQPGSVDVKCTATAKDANGKIIGQRTFHDHAKGAVVGSVFLPSATGHAHSIGVITFGVAIGTAHIAGSTISHCK
ncbi:MAG: hypothetical protein K0U29_07035 [Gammaproteobacteria bacterium]|nr:hypothetical protein [Gammaproteobacteria bacterium]MCH9744669.1 hypothetical protein [Gammaproteobacteria bacterium]